MFARLLFFAGIILLLLALSGFVLLSARTFSRQISTITVDGEKLMRPTETPTLTNTRTPTSASTGTSAQTIIPTFTPTPTLTATDTPTVTPTPTLTPPPIPTPPDAIVIVSALNLRAGPGIIYDRVGLLHTGDILDIQGRIASNEWIQVVPVTATTTSGWVAAGPEYVTINIELTTVPVLAPSPPPSTPTPTLSPTQSVPLVTSPPILLDPQPGASQYHNRIELEWDWPSTLGPDDYFQVEIRNRYLHISNVIDETWPTIDTVWVKDKYYRYDYVDEAYDREYAWRIIVVRYKSPEIPLKERDWAIPYLEIQVWNPPTIDKIEQISNPSEMRTFYIEPGDEPPPCTSNCGSGDHRGDGGSVSNPGPTRTPVPQPSLPTQTPTSTSVLPTATSSPTVTSPSTSTPSPTVTSLPTPETPTITPSPNQTSTPTFTPLTETPSLTETPNPTPTITSTPLSLSTRVIEVEWPEGMEINHSNSIRVSLIRVSEQEYVATVEVVGNKAITINIAPIGTPNTQIEKAFGPIYEGFAVANLVGIAFDIEPLTIERQSLEQPRITWDWNIIPKKGGRQVINVRIEAQWEPINGNGRKIGREIWRSPLSIEVDEPLIATKSLSLISFASLGLSSLLSAPWLYKKVRAKRHTITDTKSSCQRALITLYSNLAHLEEQAARHGMDVPLSIQNEIDYTKEKIAELEEKLAALESNPSKEKGEQ